MYHMSPSLHCIEVPCWKESAKQNDVTKVSWKKNFIFSKLMSCFEGFFWLIEFFDEGNFLTVMFVQSLVIFVLSFMEKCERFFHGINEFESTIGKSRSELTLGNCFTRYSQRMLKEAICGMFLCSNRSNVKIRSDFD